MRDFKENLKKLKVILMFKYTIKTQNIQTFSYYPAGSRFGKVQDKIIFYFAILCFCLITHNLGIDYYKNKIIQKKGLPIYITHEQAPMVYRYAENISVVQMRK